MQAYTYGEVT